MLRLAILLLLFCSLTLPVANAQSVIHHHSRAPVTFGSTAFADGVASLFINPAHLASQNTGWHYLSTQFWLHGSLEALPNNFALAFSPFDLDISADRDIFSNTVTHNDNGMGALTTFGFAGQNFGFGLLATSDTFIGGDNYPDNLTSVTNNELQAAVGLAIPFELEPFSFSLGFSVGAILRTNTTFTAAQTNFLLQYILQGIDTADVLAGHREAQNTLYGTALRLHAGILVEVWDLTFSFSLQDIGGSNLNYSITTYGQSQNDLNFFNSSRESDNEQARGYILPMDITFGIGYRPTLPEESQIQPFFWIGTSNFSLLSDPVIEQVNALNLIDIGASITIDSLFTVQAGLDFGNIAIGTGFDFGVFEINSKLLISITDIPSHAVAPSRHSIGIGVP